MNWKNKFEHEIQMGLEVRSRGNEAQARVYARRAAGIALREYFLQCGIPAHSTSAYDLLNEMLKIRGLPESARQAAEYLTLRVTEEFKLPVAVDLLSEAQVLAQALLPDPLDG